jgi:hypothetical protein
MYDETRLDNLHVMKEFHLMAAVMLKVLTCQQAFQFDARLSNNALTSKTNALWTLSTDLHFCRV